MTQLLLLSLGNETWVSKPPTYVDAVGSIALDYGMKRMAGEDGIDRNQPNWSH